MELIILIQKMKMEGKLILLLNLMKFMKLNKMNFGIEVGPNSKFKEKNYYNLNKRIFKHKR